MVDGRAKLSTAARECHPSREERAMSKRMRCADVGLDCDFAVLADDDQELMELVEEHARRVHGIEEITAELRQKILDAAQEV